MRPNLTCRYGVWRMLAHVSSWYMRKPFNASETVPARRHSWVAVLAVLVLLGGLIPLALVGNAHAATPAPLVLRVGTVNLFVATFNPLRMTLPDESFVVYNTYSTLATFDNAYHVVPSLASSWTATNATVWTVHLVSNAYFTNPLNLSDLSHPVTSADVAFSYNLQINTPASVGHVFVEGISNAIAVNATTVLLVTAQPFAPMPAALANIPILPQYIWANVPNPLSYAPPYPVGSGALYYDPGNSSTTSVLVLHRNPSYFGATVYGQSSRPDTIQLIGYSSATAMAQDFATGASGLNAIENLDPATYQSSVLAPFPRMGVDRGFVGEFSMNVMSTAERSSLVASGLTQFHSGTNNQLLLNRTVRTAVAMSINKSALVADALLGLGTVADTLVPASNPWHFSIPPSSQFAFNPALARSILNAVGWAFAADGTPATSTTVPLYQLVNGTPANPLVFRFYTLNTATTWSIAANDIIGWLAQAGIQTTNQFGNPGFAALSLNQMNVAWFTGNYDMWLWNWLFSPGADPSLNILSVETTMAIGPTSDNYYSNATYDTLYNESLVTLDGTQRAQIVDQMQSMIYSYASYVLPYYAFNLYAVRNDAPSNGSVGWTGWGDWNANPGLTPDSGLPNLWFQLQPAAPDHPPSTPVIAGTSPLITPPNTPVSFTGNATDPDPGQTLTWTWTWGDGQTTVLTTPSSATGVTASHAWTSSGVYTVTLTVSDGFLASTSAPFTVEVQGARLSSAIGRPGVPVSLAGVIIEASKGRWTLSFGDGSTTSGTFAAGVTTLTVAHTYATAGNYTVTLSAKAGSTTSIASAYVIIDGTPPVLVLPPNLVFEATANVTLVFYSVSATDNVGLAGPPTCSPPSGSRFSLGTTTVTCAVTDLAGNTATGSFTITLHDTTPPTIFVPSNLTVQATSAAGAVVNYTVSATDALGVASGPTCTPAAGSLFPMGLTIVTCTATDTSGNVRHASFPVLVVDTIAPVTTLVSAVDGNGFPLSFNVSTPSTSATFRFNGTDAVGVVGFLCALDGAPYASCASGVTYTGLAAGLHTFVVAAVDAAGNMNPVGTRWTVLTLPGTVQDLIAKVTALRTSGVLTSRQANALLAPLNKAYSDLTSGRIGATIKDLRTFNATVSQYITAGILPPATGKALQDEACDLILTLGGTC